MTYDMIFVNCNSVDTRWQQYSTVHIHTQTVHRTTQLTKLEECSWCPFFASSTFAFALQLRKKHGKTSVKVAGECQLTKSISIVMDFFGRTAWYTPFVDKRSEDILDALTAETKKTQTKLAATCCKNEQKRMPNIMLNYGPDGRRWLGEP
jgi:hypothetical protein